MLTELADFPSVVIEFSALSDLPIAQELLAARRDEIVDLPCGRHHNRHVGVGSLKGVPSYRSVPMVASAVRACLAASSVVAGPISPSSLRL